MLGRFAPRNDRKPDHLMQSQSESEPEEHLAFRHDLGRDRLMISARANKTRSVIRTLRRFRLV